MSNKDFPLLKLLIQVMEEVVEHKLDFQMESFFVESNYADRAKDIHSCGTPACVVGYGAVSPEVQKHLEIDTKFFPADEAAELVTDHLIEEIGNVAYSVFGSSPNQRSRYAYHYLPKPFPRFLHLETYQPYAKETLEYMKYVLEVKQQEE